MTIELKNCVSTNLNQKVQNYVGHPHQDSTSRNKFVLTNLCQQICAWTELLEKRPPSQNFRLIQGTFLLNCTFLLNFQFFAKKSPCPGRLQTGSSDPTHFCRGIHLSTHTPTHRTSHPDSRLRQSLGQCSLRTPMGEKMLQVRASSFSMKTNLKAHNF